MQNNAFASAIMHPAVPDERAFLRQVGRRVREARLARGMSRRVLAAGSGVSERYLAQLESGLANASILVLQHVARALEVAPARFISDDAGTASAGARDRRIALIGLRGAGKSTLGAQLAARLEVPFIELDREVERQAGVSLGAVFELYGEAGYRRYESACLEATLREHPRFVVATGGSIVSERSTYDRLLDACFTIWLAAAPDRHMERVVQQGDMRPMAGHPHAMDDLKRILADRRPLYERADRAIDTTDATVAESLEALEAAVPRESGS
jgi:XRE family transcriptional regulator, aerobic/anaerobic benzoate catabolism transcriptional regulator